MATEIGIGPVTWRIELPAIGLINFVSGTDCGQADGRWDSQLKGVDQGGITDRNGSFRQRATVKSDDSF
ncbi:hypothetical protein [Nitrobacter sp.]|uniref:hypothetical protein n=1 Tax=Nitrobacter sp. TaxID=29420 RepID=UPI00345CAC1A